MNARGKFFLAGMKRFAAAVALLSLLIPFEAGCWGFWAHQRINYMACFTLPAELAAFYKPNIRFVFTHAVDPDQRRYSDPEEAPRHFMDLDRYGGVDSIPHRWEDAVCIYTEDSLKAHGIVPWAIQRYYRCLVRAFAARDAGKVLYYSAVLGHYVGDAHVPLHCTHNYNGQLTGQKGIHGFWESRLPELYGNDFDFLAGDCVYFERPLETAWEILRESSAAVDSVLSMERAVNAAIRSDRKYSFEDRGTIVVRNYSEEYSKAYFDALDGQVERRMTLAVLRVGSYWYSAWVDAGQPSMNADTAVVPSVFPEDSIRSVEAIPSRICD